MNKERTEKIQATKAAKKSGFETQTIQVNARLRIIRFDEFNWQIQKTDDKTGKWKSWPHTNYFGQLLDAFQALPAILLDWQAKNSIAEAQRCQEAICEEIRMALNRLGC